MDQSLSIFNLAKFGPCPDHITVSIRNRFFKVTPFEADGNPWSEEKLKSYLEHLEEWVENNPAENLAFAALTAADRETWAKVIIIHILFRTFLITYFF